MKKLFSIVLAFMLVLGVTACSNNEKEPKTNENTEIIKEDKGTKVPNPIVEYETVDDAKKDLDFEPIIPNIPKDFIISTVSVIDKQIFQATFNNEETEEISYRMAKGDEDISGDYNEYEVTNEVEVCGVEAVFKGNSDEVYVMNWTDDDFTYSISFIQGVSQNIAEEILK